MDWALIIIVLVILANILLIMYIPKHKKLSKLGCDCKCDDDELKEGYETYSYGPFNYMDTGADPLTFYKYPVYRNPYMFPYKFYSSYPYPYMTYGDVNI